MINLELFSLRKGFRSRRMIIDTIAHVALEGHLIYDTSRRKDHAIWINFQSLTCTLSSHTSYFVSRRAERRGEQLLWPEREEVRPPLSLQRNKGIDSAQPGKEILLSCRVNRNRNKNF